MSERVVLSSGKYHQVYPKTSLGGVGKYVLNLCFVLKVQFLGYRLSGAAQRFSELYGFLWGRVLLLFFFFFFKQS